MTRLYFHVGRLRLRVWLTFLLCLLGFSALLGGVFFSLVQLTGDQRTAVLVIMLGAIGSILGVGSCFIWLYLRPVARLLRRIREAGVAAPSVEDEEVRRVALRFPLLFSAVVISLATVLDLLALALDLAFLDLPPRLVAGLCLASFSVLLLGTILLFVLLRWLTLPITAHFRHEEVPGGIRISITHKVILVTVSLALAAVCLPALIGAYRLDAATRDTQTLDLRHLAESLSYGATAIDEARLRQAVASLRLARDGRVRFTDQPSATASPLPLGHSRRYLEVTAAHQTFTDHHVLLVTALLLLGLALLVGRSLGRSISRDVLLIRDHLLAMAAPEPAARSVSPIVRGTPQFAEVRVLARGVNTLLARMAQMSVAHFVAVEKSVAVDRIRMQFLANVSHDLRSPLNAILGFSELMLGEVEGKLRGKGREGIAMIQRSGRQLLRLIDDVLALAKLEAGRLSLGREDCMPTDIVRQALQEVGREEIPEAIRIETDLQAGLPLVWVDPVHLAAAIAHLIRFSLASMKEGKIVLRLRAETIAPDEGDQAPAGKTRPPGLVPRQVLQIRIADTSPGLEGEEVGQLFVGFRRRSGRPGLGLELPLAKTFIEMHDGTLEVYSTPGVGTTFAINIPVLQRRATGKLRAVKV